MENKNIIIVDDMIASGKSLIDVAEELKKYIDNFNEMLFYPRLLG